MKLVIYTKYEENFGSYDIKIWKHRRGYTYVVEDLSFPQVDKIKTGGIPNLTKLIEHESSFSRESIIEYEIIENERAADEPWEPPIVFTWGGDRWLASLTELNEGNMDPLIIKQVTEWIPAEGGQFHDRKVKCLTDEGWFTPEELAEKSLSKA